MNDPHVDTVARELGLRPSQVEAAVRLLDDDATIPFIARYRKEATDSLDEVAIASIRDRVTQLRELDKRRAAIVKSLDERGLLTPELEARLAAAATMAVLEDLYLPYRPKRRTRAAIARERGLEPLAELLFAQDALDPAAEAGAFVDPAKDVATAADALAGARDIIAEWVNEDADARARLRALFARAATIRSHVIAGRETEGAKFADYFDWEEPAAKAPSHRYLAIRRGETEGVLSVRLLPPEASALAILETIFLMADNPAAEQVREAVHDSYKRLLAPALETELRATLKERADAEAVRVFADNLRELLMAPPLGRKAVLAIDPGFRTGCKVVALDRQGKLLDHLAVFPHSSDAERRDAAVEIKALCARHRISVIAIGNGTAGRETEAFVREIGLPAHVSVEMVNESGASVYSASAVAREEFPEHDVTVRGAVSIGRRLMDPLAELVKIDPQAIGVGQYQHDVDPGMLRRSLDDTVMSCVNSVGVEVNTASRELLAYVSGLGPSLAQNIVAYRDEHGPFRSRRAFARVPRLGPKAFEQAAGFLRIADADNPLDRSAVHPESYPIVERMAADLGCTVSDLMAREDLRRRLRLEDYCSAAVGLPTLTDIMAELAKPGRDPRGAWEPFHFDDAVRTLEDLKVGMQLPGIVTNVTAFGAFVDIGVHQDGLVHRSELADRWVRNPAEIVKVHQRVRVTVLDVDLARRRIALSLRR
ncbi:MAG TPA: Tex family protein [candidate division Zixibacteria bacterium]|nr:RNA-binding transcriptional accessory protein [candidate division Zixibacteria bacterium]MDD4916384.1 Tex family protein [candidate division Zixibacteria bacterium]MDM7972844.1 Tex family protein [candidate division Zixibacteria bacterium]HPM37689.1 Tex family protein [candidate division Zixibacteria bacterium]